MSIVTTYVCDVSGKNGTNREDFVDVQISATEYWKVGQHAASTKTPVKVSKLVCRDIALKLNLIPVAKDDPVVPEVTFEGKLKALLTDYIDTIVADSVAETVYQAMNNR